MLRSCGETNLPQIHILQVSSEGQGGQYQIFETWCKLNHQTCCLKDVRLILRMMLHLKKKIIRYPFNIGLKLSIIYIG